MNPETTSNPEFPNAFVHIDGDSFFASIEMAHDPSLIGRAVVTGYERGCATSMSSLAKKMGVTRGMPIRQVEQELPEVVVVAGDYKTYELYARRMYAIVRRYTGSIEEYSIDECFANITNNLSERYPTYESLVSAIKSDLQRELGITFSLGLAPTKVLAKIGSKLGKPNGLTIIPLSHISELTDAVSCKRVWGLGPASCEKLAGCGVHTIGEFCRMDQERVRRMLSKTGLELQMELSGVSVMGIGRSRPQPQSIEHTHTFGDTTSSRDYLWREVTLHTERLCTQLRKYNLRAYGVSLMLRGKHSGYRESEVVLPRHECVPEVFLQRLTDAFASLYDRCEEYNRIRVRMWGIEHRDNLSEDLFGGGIAHNYETVHSVADGINLRYGRDCLQVLDRLIASDENQRHQRKGKRSVSLWRSERERARYIAIPFLGETV